MMPFILLATKIQINSDDDKEFMTIIYQKYHRLMYSVAGTYVSSKQDREDVVQTSLENLVKHVGKLRTLPEHTVPSYIVITIRNTAYNMLKRNRKMGQKCCSIEEKINTECFSEKFFADELLDIVHRRCIIRCAGKNRDFRGKHYRHRRQRPQLRCRLFNG